MFKLFIAEPILLNIPSTKLFIVTILLTNLLNYRGADKSLAQLGRKQAIFPAFYATWRFITTFTTVHHLSPTLAK